MIFTLYTCMHTSSHIILLCYIIWWWLFIFIAILTSCQTISTTVPAEEFLRLCPNQEIIFTCVVKDSLTISWGSAEYIDTGSTREFGIFNNIGDRHTSQMNPNTVANLTDNRMEDGVRILESTLHIETLASISNFSISCMRDNGTTKTIHLQLLGKHAN